MRKRQATCSLRADGVASYLHVKITADIRERGSVLYLGMAQEFWDFAKLAIACHGLNAYKTATSATERLTQLRPSL